jgi:uncharacterized membrane protein YvlD (DUF360 family)
MIRFLVNTAVYMGAAAIGLVVADIVLGDDFRIDYPFGFLVATILFGVIQGLVAPFLASVTERNAEMLTGAVGLLSALVALVITELLAAGLEVSGFTTLFLAALVIWLASMVAGVILRLTIAKRFIEQIRD